MLVCLDIAVTNLLWCPPPKSVQCWCNEAASHLLACARPFVTTCFGHIRWTFLEGINRTTGDVITSMSQKYLDTEAFL